MSGFHTLIHLGLVSERAVQQVVATTKQSAKTVAVGPEWNVTVRAVDGGF